MMHAIVCRAFGGPLTLEEQPDRSPVESEVKIAVSASGVNFVDGLIVRGLYQIKPDLPYVPGFEVAGIVEAIGSEVRNVAVGDRVFATPGLAGGGYATHTFVDATQTFVLPSTVTPEQGATMVQSYCTGLFALTRRVDLKPGQTLLVLGAAGGVGRAAVDIGKALGARVIAGASSTERLRSAREAGADEVINYESSDLKSRVRELTNGGVDVVYDPIGSDYSEAALRALGEDGTLLIVGFAAGGIPRLPTNQMLLRNRRVVGVDWGGWRSSRPELQDDLMRQLCQMIEDNKLHPPSPSVYALTAAQDALDALASRTVHGKVALIP
ncbi:MAG: NADPH:quinone oxidoreductase family protein [Pseudomonadota bacterium]